MGIGRSALVTVMVTALASAGLVRGLVEREALVSLALALQRLVQAHTAARALTLQAHTAARGHTGGHTARRDIARSLPQESYHPGETHVRCFWH